MARRKKTRHASTRRTPSRKHSPRRRRRSHLSAGPFSNPLIGAAAGAVAAGFIGGLLSKPGSDGKPMIESPMLRVALIGGAGFFAGKFLKSPALGLGAVAVSAYALMKQTAFKDSAMFGGLSEDAEISYVDKNLLNDGATTLSNSTTLALGDGTYLEMQNGQWQGPYSATGY